MLKILLSLVFLQSALAVYGQNINLQVVTKTIEKEMAYSQGKKLNIQGEKSEVDIMSWEKDYISIVLILRAQHPDRSVAEEDLNFFSYSFEDTKEAILVKNKIIDKEERLRSGLQAYYTIYVPTTCAVKLSNYFGQAELNNLTHGVDINSEFCNLRLKNVQGNVKVDTYYGDLIGVSINGDVDIQANRSNVTLSEIEGKYSINSYMGTVKVFANQSLLDLNIEAVKSDVFFYDAQLSKYNFDLSSKQGNIELPDNLVANYGQSNEFKNIIVKPDNEMAGIRVAINVVSGNIMVGSR